MPRANGTERVIWSFEANAARLHAKELSDEQLQAAVTPTNVFRKDLLAYCKVLNIIPHPRLLPIHPDEEEIVTSDLFNAHAYDLNAEIDHVVIKHWQLDPGNCRALCLALPHATKVYALTLFHVELTTDQLHQIAQMLPKTEIRHLQLEWNGLTQSIEKAAESTDASNDEPEPVMLTSPYARLLDDGCKLTFVSLRANGMTSDQAALVAKALRTNSTVQSLNLFENAIGDDGALAIAYALPFNTTLKTLSLANNRLSGTVARILIDVLTKYVAPPALLKEMEDAEGRIQAEMELAKKAKKKFDRAQFLQQLGLPVLEKDPQPVPPGSTAVYYAPGNATLQDLILSGNEAIDVSDLQYIQAQFTTYQEKLETHFRRLKLQRINALKAYASSASPSLSPFFQF